MSITLAKKTILEAWIQFYKQGKLSLIKVTSPKYRNIVIMNIIGTWPKILKDWNDFSVLNLDDLEVKSTKIDSLLIHLNIYFWSLGHSSTYSMTLTDGLAEARLFNFLQLFRFARLFKFITSGPFLPLCTQEGEIHLNIEAYYYYDSGNQTRALCFAYPPRQCISWFCL